SKAPRLAIRWLCTIALSRATNPNASRSARGFQVESNLDSVTDSKFRIYRLAAQTGNNACPDDHLIPPTYSTSLAVRPKCFARNSANSVLPPTGCVDLLPWLSVKVSVESESDTLPPFARAIE